MCEIRGHKIPDGACDKYAYALKMCLDEPSGLRKFNFKRMDKEEVWDYCRFCKEGKDLEGDLKYGEMWQGRSARR